MLIIMAGPSGVGKNAVINELIKYYPNLEIMKSCTTRKPRNDKDNNYYYLSKEEFEKKKENGEFFETEMVHSGDYYGVLSKSIETVIDEEGNKDYIKDIDVNGSDKISSFLRGKAKVLKIFLDAPDEVLKERLEKRGETPEKIELRQSRYEYERQFKSKYDVVINNIVFDTTLKLVRQAIEKRKLAQI